MRVNPQDGRCRSCGGTLEVMDVDDATMTVECSECGDSYDVEPDAFGDGAMDYYVDSHLERLQDEAASSPQTLAEYLAQLKVGDIVPRPADEDSEALIARIAHAEPGQIYVVDEETYFYYLEVLPPRFMSGGLFGFAEGSGTLLLFWRPSQDVYHARPLDDAETDTFYRLAKISRYL